MIDNKKFLKEISNIFTAADKAKKVVLSEMDKIDEKYRKLADEEKKQLNSILANLNEQIKLYGPMLNTDKDTPVATEETTPAPEEEMVVDTIYKENNADPFSEENVEEIVNEPESEGEEEPSSNTPWPDAVVTEDVPENEDTVEETEGNVRPADISDEWPISAEW